MRFCLKQRLLSFLGGVRGRTRILSTCERRCRVLRYKWKQREAARTRGQTLAALRGVGSAHAGPPPGLSVPPSLSWGGGPAPP